MKVNSDENDYYSRLLPINVSEHAKIAKIISLIERSNFDIDLVESKKNALIKTGVSIAITGGAGVGKSTFIDKFIFQAILGKKSIAVLAIDPTSKVTCGTLLGDRIRFNVDYPSKGVYIRSIASSDSSTSIPASLASIVRFLKVVGFNIILVETIGIGQGDIEINKHVEKIVTIPSHDSDDWVQQFKLGVNEISNLYFINKTDKVNPKMLKNSIQEYLSIKFPNLSNFPEIVEGSALQNIGIKTAYDILVSDNRF